MAKMANFKFRVGSQTAGADLLFGFNCYWPTIVEKAVQLRTEHFIHSQYAILLLSSPYNTTDCSNSENLVGQEHIDRPINQTVSSPLPAVYSMTQLNLNETEP